MSENRAKFTAGAFGIIFNEQGQVLLAHRTDHDMWNLPGGQVDSGEAPWEAVVREIKEETGFDAEVIKLCGVYNKEGKNDISFSFLCRVTGGEVTLSSESDKVEYFSIDKMPPNTIPKQVQRIKDALDNKNQVVLKTLSGKSWKEEMEEGNL